MTSFGVTAWKIDAEDIDVIQRASELGFEAIELGIYNMENYEEFLKPATQAAYVEAADKYGIKIVGMLTGVFSLVVSIYDKEKETTVWEVLSNLIDATIAMNISVLTCAIFGEYSINNAEQMERTSMMLRRAFDYIGDRPLQIATENTLSN